MSERIHHYALYATNNTHLNLGLTKYDLTFVMSIPEHFLGYASKCDLKYGPWYFEINGNKKLIHRTWWIEEISAAVYGTYQAFGLVEEIGANDFTTLASIHFSF